MTTKVNPALADVILDSLNDGLYVCDLDRTILYWTGANPPNGSPAGRRNRWSVTSAAPTSSSISTKTAAGELLGTEGLIRILKSLAYPQSPIKIEALQQALLTASNEIRLDDDLALLEIRFS